LLDRASGSGYKPLMLFEAALIGFAFGFLGSIPLAGPIAALVWSRGLEDRARSALYLASGAAVAEGAYAYLAFLGFAQIFARYGWIEPASRIAAAAASLGLGLRFVQRPRSLTRAPRDVGAGHRRAFLLGLTLTAFNPILLVTWAAAIAALYSLDLVRLEPWAALPFSLGACAGITAWFATLLGLGLAARRL